MFGSDVMGNTKKAGKPKPEHLMQTMLYLNHFEDVPYFSIVYIDRGDMTKGEHQIELFKASDLNKRFAIVNGEPQLEFSIGKIYQRYLSLDQAVQRKDPPPRDYTIRYSADQVTTLTSAGRLSKTKQEDFKKGKLVGDWQCLYCSYRTKCWGNRY